MFPFQSGVQPLSAFARASTLRGCFAESRKFEVARRVPRAESRLERGQPCPRVPGSRSNSRGQSCPRSDLAISLIRPVEVPLVPSVLLMVPVDSSGLAKPQKVSAVGLVGFDHAPNPGGRPPSRGGSVAGMARAASRSKRPSGFRTKINTYRRAASRPLEVNVDRFGHRISSRARLERVR